VVDVISALSSDSNLSCVITENLFGFSASFDRIKRFINEYSFPIAFIFLCETSNKDFWFVNISLTDGVLDDGKAYVCVLGSDLVADTPHKDVLTFARFLNEKRDRTTASEVSQAKNL
jgi:hypothetical protein